MKEKIESANLKIGDVVTFLDLDSAFGRLTVVQKDDKQVEFFRIYTSLAGFTYSDNRVIPYIGTEKIVVPLPSSHVYEFIENIYRPNV
jgi:hypothetical protein